MLCENCGKKDATSIFLPSGENKIKYLCGACYKKINNTSELEDLALEVTKSMHNDALCNACGTSYVDFTSNGLFGCADCYKAFDFYIKSKILPIFNEQKYLGKKPNFYYVEQEIKNLEELIELNLKNGNYQKATKYGIELKKLKEENYDKL